MRNKLWRRLLQTPCLKLVELALLIVSGGLYIGAYGEAAYGSQVLAAVASVIALLLIANTIPAGPTDFN